MRPPADPLAAPRQLAAPHPRPPGMHILPAFPQEGLFSRMQPREQRAVETLWTEHMAEAVRTAV